MVSIRGLVAALAVFVVAVGLATGHAVAAPVPASDGWTLSTTDTGAGYSPTFLGNGYFAGRIPATGTGYATSPIEAESQLAGFYAHAAGQVDQRANIPTWSTLAFSDGSGTYGRLPTSSACAFGEVCQAEAGQLSGGAVVAADHNGYTGAGFVAGYQNVGATATLHLTGVPSGGAYTLAARAANYPPASADGGACLPRTLSVLVNGTDTATITFPATSSWDDWAVATTSVTLPAGDDTVAFTRAADDCGNVNLDYVSFSAPGEPLPQPVDGTGTVSDYRQTLDLHKGLLTTQATWTSPAGRATDLTYQVMVDQARQRVAAVHLTFTPRWSGTATVTGMFDGTDARLSTESAKGYEDGESYESIHTVGTDITAALASRLDLPAGARTSEVGADLPQSVGEQASFDVESGTTYTITKYVAVASSQDAADPLLTARRSAASASRIGYPGLLAGHEGAWADLWRSDIQIADDPSLQLRVRASLFYLLESARPGVDWSASPAGLSSDGYNGHIFWDAETWMYPALLATHPDVAVGMDNYRFDRLAAARANATRTGFAGARFPWESALHGDEQTPPCCDEGVVEQHITADVALAQWQYYLATGDRTWLADRGWPVLQGAAEFWASHAVSDPSGGYEINDVMGPDEYHDHVNNSVYTNVGAATTLRIATQAAQIVGEPADPRWTTIADGLRIPFDTTRNIHPEFDGYSGDTVKQADVVMLQYPWEFAMPATVAQNDLDYYVPRTDPDGPSMTDSIHSIDTAALGTPGCADYYFLQRSVDPFMRGPFDQFSEARSGGAFTFTTGTGGFLQEFLYGFSGLRWRADRLHFDPTLPPQLHGVTLRQLSWQGRHFDIAIGPTSTTITLTSGPAAPIEVAGQASTLHTGGSLTVPTRRPDLQPTDDLARCAPVTASSADPSYPATGATDGSPVTSWRPTSETASVQADLGSTQTLSHATLSWDTTRAADYTLDVSTDGNTWRQVAAVTGASGPGPDRLSFPAAEARYLRLSITATSSGHPAALSELTADA